MLYTGMRTKHCRKIADKTCLAAEQIILNFRTNQILVGGRVIWTEAGLYSFARFDGFESWAGMAAFWDAKHDMPMVFEGWHIRWLPLPEIA